MGTRGRPSTYSEEIAARICEAVAGGVSLSRICQEPWLPAYRTVLSWQKAHPEFAAWMRDARVDGARVWANRILADLDKSPASTLDASLQRERTRARLWLVAKILPSALGGIAADPTPAALAKARRIAERLSQPVESSLYDVAAQAALEKLPTFKLLKGEVRQELVDEMVCPTDPDLSVFMED